MLCIKKKKYSYWLIDKKTLQFKMNRAGDPDLMNKGIVLARRDNCAWQREVYELVLRGLMLGRTLDETLDVIYENIFNLLHKKVPWNKLTIIRSLGSNYKAPTYFMKVFGDELQKLGKPAKPGDRLDYLIVVSKNEERLLGMKMRLPETYLERLGTPDSEQIDVGYYIEKVVMKSIEQLVQVGYRVELEQLQEEYSRRDWIRLFYKISSWGFGDMVNNILSVSSSYREAYDTLYANPPRGFKTKINALRVKYITRFGQINTRRSNKPIKQLLKMISVRDTYLRQIRDLGSKGPLVNLLYKVE